MDSLFNFLMVFLVLVVIVLFLLGALWGPLNRLLNGTPPSREAEPPRPVRNAVPSPPSIPPTRHRRARSLYRARGPRQIDYGFSYEQQSDDSWRVYITSQPGYGGRADDAHTTHRYSDGGRRYICWSATIRTLEQARQVSAMWADATEKYIHAGTRF
jgi:hypothetical protein